MCTFRYLRVSVAALAVLVMPVASAGDADTPVTHVVLVWLKEPGNTEHRAQVIDATRRLAAAAGAIEVRVGTPVPSDRPNVDDGFDVGLYMVFDSKQSLDAYLANPEHVQAVRSILKPLAAETIVYDFYDGIGEP